MTSATRRSAIAGTIPIQSTTAAARRAGRKVENERGDDIGEARNFRSAVSIADSGKLLTLGPVGLAEIEGELTHHHASAGFIGGGRRGSTAHGTVGEAGLAQHSGKPLRADCTARA